ncbi:MAG: DUF3035 domain-containing protein [Alphaproteobacteria bacterium]|nr:DUF3035 domain-containing protein [Alphaproteobacteria bacterium]
MKNIALVLMMLLVLGACSKLNRDTLGMNKKAPNEFLVTTRPPLSLPPEFDLKPVSANVVEDKVVSEDEGFLDKLNAE